MLVGIPVEYVVLLLYKLKISFISFYIQCLSSHFIPVACLNVEDLFNFISSVTLIILFVSIGIPYFTFFQAI